MYLCSDGLSFNLTLRRANLSMYQFKHSGGQKCRFSHGLSFNIKHSGGPMYRCSDGLSFIFNTQKGKCSDLTIGFIST
jgi:hypothetical protein